MHIAKIQLKNFQAHKNTEISFTPGVNVIVGASDRGKSSIIRALQLVFFNKPSGTAYIRHGAKESRVKVTMADGTEVHRVRTKSKNYYQIEENEPLKVPGRDVPTEVSALCPMQPINFQGQHDAPFMLSETAGECGRMLNRCVDLTVIDKVLSNLNNKKRKASNEVEHITDNIKARTIECEKYAKVPLMVEDVAELQKLLDGSDTLTSAVAKLEASILAVANAKNALVASHDPSDALEVLGALVASAEVSAKLKAEEEELHRAIRRVVEAEGDLADMQETVDEMQKVLDELMGDTCPLCGAVSKEGDTHA